MPNFVFSSLWNRCNALSWKLVGSHLVYAQLTVAPPISAVATLCKMAPDVALVGFGSATCQVCVLPVPILGGTCMMLP